jgi:uncharacterized protein YbbC (DUF1343 family)
MHNIKHCSRQFFYSFFVRKAIFEAIFKKSYMSKTDAGIIILFLSLLFPLAISACSNPENKNASVKAITAKTPIINDTIKPGARLPEKYLPLLKGKRVGLIANQTSLVKDEHLLDFLMRNGVDVVKIFSPEHGFRGNIERGKSFNAHTDEKTGLPIIPMYGNSRKPQAETLENVDILVFDIQDVGARFYTYISSMHLAMEAAAENDKAFLVLDRPNPLGDYTDGPILDLKFRSFVGMHPIPVVHGLTVGELALMINGEGWLANEAACKLTVIPCENYSHSDAWHLEVKPSPNLPNDVSVRLYPSLCFFEATQVSIGRGTEFPFQLIGYPDSSLGAFSFTPKDMPGVQMNPVQENQKCYGVDLRDRSLDAKFTLKYLIQFNDALKSKGIKMISNPRWFNLLAGNDKLLKQINEGKSEQEIKASWQAELEAYNAMRKKYLLYPDFE